MPLLRNTVRIPMFTQIPEDVVTNTLYVDTLGIDPTPTMLIALNTAFTAFYNTAFAGGMMSPVMVTSGSRLLTYDMSDPEPRTPISDQVMPISGTIEGTTGYVEEAAVVLSFQAVRVSGEPQARRRGRIYLGCLSTAAIANGGATQFSSVTSTFRNQVSNAAEGLAAELSAADMPWMVYSRTSGAWYAVNDGWIDVNPDTQRRRGARAPQRTLWTAS